MMKRHPLPTQECLKELFLYEEETGRLYWKYRPENSFYDLRSARNWNTKYAGKEAGTKDKNGAIVFTLECKVHFAHRIIYKIKTGLEPPYIDHFDLNPGNNLFDNLRPASNAQNSWNKNKYARNTSGYKGVTYDKIHRKWVGRVGFNYKSHGAGYFDKIEDAAAAVCILREKLHGSFFRHDLSKE